MLLLVFQATRAEVKVANFIMKHYVPFSLSDHLSPQFHDVFTDSQIAKQCVAGGQKYKDDEQTEPGHSPHFQSKR